MSEYERRWFAGELLKEVDAYWQIERKDRRDHYTPEFKAFVLEAVEWLEENDLYAAAVISNALDLSKSRWKHWLLHEGTLPFTTYITEPIKKALEGWTHDADASKIEAGDRYSIWRLDEPPADPPMIEED